MVEQKKIYEIMLKLDGTENKNNLGSNAILRVSMAFCKVEQFIPWSSLLHTKCRLHETIAPTEMLAQALEGIVQDFSNQENAIDQSFFWIGQFLNHPYAYDQF